MVNMGGGKPPESWVTVPMVKRLSARELAFDFAIICWGTCNKLMQIYG